MSTVKDLEQALRDAIVRSGDVLQPAAAPMPSPRVRALEAIEGIEGGSNLARDRRG